MQSSSFPHCEQPRQQNDFGNLDKKQTARNKQNPNHWNGVHHVPLSLNAGLPKPSQEAQ
jgi:hypothetical protein